MAFGSDSTILAPPILGARLGSPLIIGAQAPRQIVLTGAQPSAQLAIADTWVQVQVQASGVQVVLPSAAQGVQPGYTVFIQMVSVTSTADVLNIIPALNTDTMDGQIFTNGAIVCVARPRETRAFYCTSVIGGVVNWECFLTDSGVETYTTGPQAVNLNGQVIVPIIFMGKQISTAGAIMAGIRTVTAFRFGVTPPVTAGTLTATLRFAGNPITTPALQASTVNPNGLEAVASTHNAQNTGIGAWPAQVNNGGAGGLWDVSVVGAGPAVGPTTFVAGFSIF